MKSGWPSSLGPGDGSCCSDLPAPPLQLRWQTDTTRKDMDGLIVGDGNTALCTVNGNEVKAIDIGGGNVKWRLIIRERGTGVWAFEGRGWCVTEPDQLVSFDLDTGEEICRREGSVPMASSAHHVFTRRFAFGIDLQTSVELPVLVLASAAYVFRRVSDQVQWYRLDDLEKVGELHTESPTLSCATDRTVTVLTGGAYVTFSLESGEAIFTVPHIGRSIERPVASRDQITFAQASGSGCVYQSHDAPTGELIWRDESDVYNDGLMICSEEAIWECVPRNKSAFALNCRSLETGEVTYSLNLPKGRPSYMAGFSGLLFITIGRTIYCYEGA